jgi:hypothetical protein
MTYRRGDPRGRPFLRLTPQEALGCQADILISENGVLFISDNKAEVFIGWIMKKNEEL